MSGSYVVIRDGYYWNGNKHFHKWVEDIKRATVFPNTDFAEGTAKAFPGSKVVLILE
jgi:hypothetical protein